MIKVKFKAHCSGEGGFPVTAEKITTLIRAKNNENNTFHNITGCSVTATLQLDFTKMSELQC